MIGSLKEKSTSEKLSFISVIKPVYVVLSLFGLFPYSLNCSKNKGVVIIKKSIYFSSLCAVSVILMIYSFFALHVQQVFGATESNTMTEFLVTKMNYMFELANFTIFCTVAYISAFRNRLNYPKILNAIASLCNNFPCQNRNIILRDIQVQVRIVMSFLSIFLVMQLVVNSTRDDSVWKMTLVALTFILPQMIQFAVIGFYYVLLFALSTILKNLDRQIGEIIKMKSMILGWLKVEMRPFSLRQSEVAYVKVIEIKREITKAFQASLLVTALQCFHTLVSEAHIIFDGLTSNNNFTTHDTCNCSIWMMYQLIKIYTVAYSGTLLKEEEAKIGRSLYEIPTGKQDIILFLEIQHFSSLMSHQTTELTVYGWFALDAKLIFNIIASATMYLTILVQFERKP